jgi:Holliday junction DNA helicase RuvA
MFARLTGTVDSIFDTSLILDVQGVGYLVTCSGRTLSRLEGPGTPARLHIETQVREDAISLFGFIDAEEQQWFKLLTTVQGVGARVAMNILSACSPHDIHMAIMAQDKAVVSQADGVGPKLATRIVTELKDKVPKIDLGRITTLPTARGGKGATPSTGMQAGGTPDADAVSALINLGYGRAEAFTAVMRARTTLEQNNEKSDNVGDLIRLSLSELANG